MANRLAEHQGRVPQPGVPTGKRNRRRPVHNRIAAHQGRTPQPGVPTGKRNRPKPTKAERRNRALAAALATKPLHYHRETAEEKAERRRAAAAVAVLRRSDLGRALHPSSPTVPTATARDTGNRPGFAPTKAEAFAAPALSDLEKLHAEGKIGKSLGTKIYEKIAEGGIYVLPEGAELKAGAEGLAVALRGATAGDVRVGGSNLLSKVLKPVEATSAADRAAITSRAAERAAAKEGSGVKAAARKVGERATRAQSKADAAVARRVAGKTSRKEAIAAAGPPLKVAKLTAAQALPVVRGHEQAVLENPGKVAKTTARAIPGLVTVPVGQVAALGITGGRAVSQGAHELGVPGARGYSTSEILAPVKGLAKDQAAFARQVGQVLTQDDSAEVQEAVEDELGLLLPLMLGLGTKAVADKISRGKITEAVKRVVDNTRAAQHKGEAVRVSRAGARTRRETQDRTRKVRQEAGRTKGSERLGDRTVRGGRVHRRDRPLKIHAGDIANFLQRHSIDPLDNPEAALAEVKRIGSRLKPLPEGMTTPRSKITTRDVVAAIERNPHWLRDKHVAAEIDEFRKQGRYAREHAEELAPEHSERARFVPTAVTRDVPLTEERFPTSVRDITRAEPARGALAKDVLRRESRSDRQRARRLGKKAERGETRARIMQREARIRETQVEPRAASEVARKAKIKRLEARRRNIAAKRQALRDKGSQSKLMSQYRRAQEGINRQLAELQVEPMTARKKQRIELGRRADGRAAVASRQRKMAAAAREAATRKHHAATEIDPTIEPEFVSEMESRLRAEGRPMPEWSSTAVAKDQPSHGGTTGAKITPFPGRSKFRSGFAEEHGLVQEDLASWLRGSVARPVSRRESFKAMRSFLADNQYVDPKSGRSEFTSHEAGRIFDDGSLDRDDWALIPSQLYKRTIDPEELAGQFKLALDAKGEIAPGRRYRLVKRPAAAEFMAQLDAKTIAPKVAAINRATSFLILGTSPAWAVAQIVAEYAQGAAAQPRILNPLWARKALKAYKDLPDEKRWAFESWAGVTKGEPVAPGELHLDPRTGDLDAAANAWSVMNRTPLGRFVKSIPKSLSTLDQWKGGRARILVGAAKLDHDLNSRLPVFLRGMRGLYAEIGRASHEMKGKPLAEQLAWVSDHPEFADRYAAYLDDVMGNWHALTRNEQVASRILLFYPFIRMAARWTFYAFPKRHPIKAAMLTYLGQQNAVTLHHLLGADPSYFTEWATVPLHLGGKTELLPLSRIAPGTGLATELLGEGTKNLPGLALSSLQPGVASAIIAATGVDPQSGEQEPGRGIAALSQLLNLSPVVRLADAEMTPKGQKPTDQALPVFGPLFGSTERQKALDKLFGKLEQRDSDTAAVRRLVAPTQPQQLGHERDLIRLRKILDTISANSSTAQRDLGVREAERAGESSPAQIRSIEIRTAKQRKQMEAAGDKAQKQLDALFAKYKVPADRWSAEVYGIAAFGSKPGHRGVIGTGNGFGVPAGETGSTGSRYGVPIGKTRGRPTRSETETWGVPVR